MLLHVLLKRLLSHYALRLTRQQLGFEGGDLIIQERRRVVDAAASIPRSAIILVSGEREQYTVESQAKPSTYHHVDMSSCTCSCPAFSKIMFCKHICAIQTHFPSGTCEKIVHFCPPAAPEAQGASTLSNSASTSASDSLLGEMLTGRGGENAPEKGGQGPPDSMEADRSIAGLVQDLQILVGRLTSSPDTVCTPRLAALAADVRGILADNLEGPSRSLLPAAVKIAPNQHSWPETAQKMIGPIKRTKRKIADPYAGGESSGKKAKKDAKQHPQQ